MQGKKFGAHKNKNGGIEHLKKSVQGNTNYYFGRIFAKNAKTLLRCFLLFINEQIVSDIVLHTNSKDP